MLKFIMKRLVYAIITLFIISTITFILIRAIPGKPMETMLERLPEQIRQNYYAKYGLDKPIIVQYKQFWRNLLVEGDLGESLAYRGRKVNDIIKTFAPVSGRLGIQAIVIGISIGLILGIVAALNRNKWPDYVVMFIAILGVSIPSFVVASLLQYSFTIKRQILPTTGWEGFKYTILPSIALSFASIAKYARYMRANCLDVINQDYILTAKAKGASKSRLIKKHILRNAMLPIITLLAPQIATVFEGSFVIEKIFAIPGLGSYFVSSVSDRDCTMVLGQTIFIAFLYIVSLVVVDILYGLIDPRIRLSHKEYRR
ncbi:ABC transporter permease [Sporanaerobacter acetigenes]|uniref:Oligopeptide transport system permease protein n=1 Tax=Sporanaerobacter acetigenes DSM 13106 TaxID=1123281 RepID=A0A1M5VPC9_9FIRM|nr:ABC transporter permease [Sporanaerobacter acetigenes]SHH77087.1 oligopeptide transport system permease protein [Sporanaerobacter acetigenes DSM 13106]